MSSVTKIDRRSLALGFGGGVMAAGVVVGAVHLVDTWLDDPLLDVTEAEVQLSAVRAFVDANGLAVGSRPEVTVHYGGPACGGVVEVAVGSTNAVYVVHEDSGDALPAELRRSSVLEAISEMSGADDQCF